MDNRKFLFPTKSENLAGTLSRIKYWQWHLICQICQNFPFHNFTLATRIWYMYVTGFDKSLLPHTQWHHMHTFHHHTIHPCTCIHKLTVQAGIGVTSYVATQVALFLNPVRCPQVLGWSLNNCISPGQADSWMYVNHHSIGWWCWLCLCDFYIGLKIIRNDVIWLF